MRFHEIIEGRDKNHGNYSADQARDIGSCSIIAICNLTGKSWDEVWEAAKPNFNRYGMNSGGTSAVLRHFGYEMQGYYKMPWTGPAKPPEFKVPTMTVNQSTIWLKQNDPTVSLWASINAGGQGHAIAYVDGEWRNTLGYNKARLHLVNKIVKI